MVLVGGVLALVVGVGILAWSIYSNQGDAEERRNEIARSAYRDGHYAKAAEEFGKLAEDYPDSVQRPEYLFLGDLAHLRDQAGRVGAQPDPILDGLKQFRDRYRTSPYPRDPGYAKDISALYEQVARLLAEEANRLLVRRGNLESARQLILRAERVLAEAGRFRPPGTPMDQAIASSIAEARRKLGRLKAQEQALAEARGLPATLEGLRTADALIRRRQLVDDPEARGLLAGLRQAILAGVSYVPAVGVSGQAGPAQPPYRSLVVVQPTPPTGGPAGAPIFALARGVLYALSGFEGAVLWATRVGIDTTELPVRVPAAESLPEVALVLSTDDNVLSARDALNGRELWRHRLGSPCRGRPLLVDRTAYVATEGGQVDELDLSSGRLVGRFQLNASLSGWGAYDAASHLLYFPGRELAVFVLDRIEKRCVAVVETGHASGALRGAPLLIGGGSHPADYFVLSEADGMEATRLAAYHLPALGIGPAAAAEPVLRVPGWTWFPARFDGERIALATDLAGLHLAGVNQARDQDPILYLTVSGPADVRSAAGAADVERAQVVFATEHEFWVIAHGILTRHRLGVDRKAGLTLAVVPGEPLALGAPLQAGQVSSGGETLFTVSQSLDHEVVITALETSSGRVRWQRRLGAVALGDPVPAGSGLVLGDQGGALTAFTPGADAALPGAAWARAGESRADVLGRLIAGPWMVRSPSGDWLQVSTVARQAPNQPRPTNQLVIRQISGKDGTIRELTFDQVREPLAGAPAAGPDYLILPLASGELWRLPLGDAPPRPGGVSWRSRDADADSSGHALWVSGDRFIVTDGARGAALWSWAAGGGLPQVEKQLTLPRQVAGPPVLLATDTKARPRVCVAGVDGHIQVVNGDDLSVVRSWSLGAPVTTPPFARGGALGVVLERQRLVWIRPDSSRPAWEHTAAGAIVGQPQFAGGALLIADVTGRLVGLDPETGKPRGNGVTLSGTVVPAAAPAGFGDDAVLVPLSDGTVAVCPLSAFR